MFGYIFRSLMARYFPSRNVQDRYEWLAISIPNEVDVGFIKLRQGFADGKSSCLELIAIVPQHRNRGIGSAVLDHIVAGMAAEGNLYVHCTKYARAMQHILKRRQFKRNVRFQVPNLETQSPFALRFTWDIFWRWYLVEFAFETACALVFPKDSYPMIWVQQIAPFPALIAALFWVRTARLSFDIPSIRP